MERALIIGCGYTGTRLARRLAQAGVDVVGTSTGPRERSTDLRWLELDLLDDTALELPEAAGAVVYYMVSTLARRYEARPHIRPFERCLDALGRQPLQGVIYLSSTSVYGDRGGEWVDEQSPTKPGSPWGRMRVDLEQAVWRFGETRGIPACVARLPEIYGPGRGPLERLRAGGHVVHAPARFSNRIHVDDLVLALEQLGRQLSPELLLLSDDEPAPTLEVYRFAAEQLGLDPDGLRVGSGDVEGDANRRGLVLESKRCSNRRLRSWLEQPLRYPTYRAGIMAIRAAEQDPAPGSG